MTGYSPAFKKDIENRIKNGTLKVAGQGPALVPSIKSVLAAINQGNSGSETMRNLQALGRMKTGRMNKTEIAYSQYLEGLKACGEIVWWKFEAIKLRLADSTFYTVDFFVMKASGDLEAHEVKGHWMDDARVKIKVAAESFPFRFIAVQKKSNKQGGGWKIEVFE
ncbi:hypothetical protein [Nitrosomonas sp.]|uniref:hypothetical protein n=1 Tax=Nitrosomonas sp. TaxID=42353 RepID=UPI0025CFCAC3|nr:hypothetical protein [Nitrosomonas sp.]